MSPNDDIFHRTVRGIRPALTAPSPHAAGDEWDRKYRHVKHRRGGHYESKTKHDGEAPLPPERQSALTQHVGVQFDAFITRSNIRKARTEIVERCTKVWGNPRHAMAVALLYEKLGQKGVGWGGSRTAADHLDKKRWAKWFELMDANMKEI